MSQGKFHNMHVLYRWLHVLTSALFITKENRPVLIQQQQWEINLPNRKNQSCLVKGTQSYLLSMLSLQKVCLQLSDLINLKLNIKNKYKKKTFWFLVSWAFFMVPSVKKAVFQTALNVCFFTNFLSKIFPVYFPVRLDLLLLSNHCLSAQNTPILY